jgi:hypothetical protein
MVVEASNPNDSRGGDWEDHNLASLGKKIMRPHVNQWLDAMTHTSSPAMRGIINRRIRVQTDLRMKQVPISKIIKSKEGLAELSSSKVPV